MPILRRKLLQASLMTLFAGCGDGTGPDPVSPIAEVIVFGESDDDTVRVLAGTLEILRASLRDAAGNSLSLLDSALHEDPDRNVTWSSADPSKAQVSEVGLGPAGIYSEATVTGVSPGTVAIHAAAGSKVGSIQVIVLERAASLQLRPSRLGIVPTGVSSLFSDYLDAAGNPLDPVGRFLDWTSSDPATAEVATGSFPSSQFTEVTGVAPGTATIMASGSGAEGSMQVDVSLLTFTSLATGLGSTCGVTTTGESYCWGADLFGGGTILFRSETPIRIEGIEASAAISPAAGETCTLATDGAAACWGGNESGQLGSGFFTEGATPTPVSGGLQFSALSSGEDYVCALTLAGKPYCWGAGSQLGAGTLEDRAVPTPVAADLTLASISATRGNPRLLHSARHTCGVATDGNAWCWGNNAQGELGDNSTTDRLVPVQVAGTLTFSSISAGPFYTCGIAGNQAYCWGDNAHGQLGSSAASALTPVPVTGGLSLSSVSAGFTHACGITTAGSAYCWGQNDFGQLGDGSNTASVSPVPVSGGHSFSSVSAGDRYTCGLTVQQAAYCWGGALDDVNDPAPTGTRVLGSTVPLKVIGQP